MVIADIEEGLDNWLREIFNIGYKIISVNGEPYSGSTKRG